MKIFKGINRELGIFFIISALIGLALGLSDSVFSNYFKDAYNVNAYQRGIIEFPRELPGLLCLVVVGLGSFLGDIRMAIIAQILATIGLLVLGLFTPPFGIMLIFLFINSLGMHFYMPLQDSIGMSLVEKEGTIGKRMGQYSSVRTGFGMLAGGIVFIGFRLGWLSFTTPIKYIFLIPAGLYIIILLLYLFLKKIRTKHVIQKRGFTFVFKKEYKFYYILATMHGAQKQIMLVFGPWILIEILKQGADTIALLSIIGAFIGIFFLPLVGRWIDKFGIKKMLYIDALTFIGVYIAYGLVSGGFVSGALSLVGFPVLLVSSLFIADKLSMQFDIVKIVYLRSIALDPKDITPTLSTGISMDHVVSILCAFTGGSVWTIWGPQYVFFMAALLSLVNLAVAILIKEKN